MGDTDQNPRNPNINSYEQEPDGFFSGMTKRVAVENGSFTEVEGMPRDTRGPIKDRPQRGDV